MVFWAIEVEPGETVSPFDACPCCESTKLRITQAALGLGSSKEKSILQCVTKQKNTVFLCALLPRKNESCSLDLELEKDDSLTFSVLGSRSIHLSGYYVEADESDTGKEGYGIYDSDGSGSLGSEDSMYDSDDDTNEDDFYYENSDEDYNAAPKSGVVIEEIIDDDKAVNGNSQSKQPKKNKRKDSLENGKQGQIVLRNGASVPVLESEDEDGLPISKTAPEEKSEAKGGQTEKETTEEVPKKKRDKNIEHDDHSDRRKKVKKQKQADKESKNDKEFDANGNDKVMEDQEKLTEVQNGEAAQVLPLDPQNDNNETQSGKKKKKKKGKKSQDTGNEPAKTDAEKDASTLVEEKPSQVRTFSNGLVVEELSMGKPDGKRAAPGKQVSVHYIGKLQKNGKIFDSNVGSRPFKFRLGIGEVIKGWDVGVNGMRVGDKRRLTIPPAMGYGAKGAGGKIPPNSWLVFDVELVNVH